MFHRRRPKRSSFPAALLSWMWTSNGEVEGPDDHVGLAPRAHTVPRRPRRQTAHASRPPPTIVRCAHRVSCGTRYVRANETATPQKNTTTKTLTIRARREAIG